MPLHEVAHSSGVSPAALPDVDGRRSPRPHQRSPHPIELWVVGLIAADRQKKAENALLCQQLDFARALAFT